MTKRNNPQVEKDYQDFQIYKIEFEVEIYLLAKYSNCDKFIAFLSFRDSDNNLLNAYDLLLERIEETRLRNIENRKLREDNKHLIKELRQRTALGLTECLIALKESKFDFDKAVEYIQYNYTGRSL